MMNGNGGVPAHVFVPGIGFVIQQEANPIVPVINQPMQAPMALLPVNVGLGGWRKSIIRCLILLLRLIFQVFFREDRSRLRSSPGSRDAQNAHGAVSDRSKDGC